MEATSHLARPGRTSGSRSKNRSAAAAARIPTRPATPCACATAGQLRDPGTALFDPEQANGFTELALTFHHTADGIAVAAERGDEQAVLRVLGDTLAQCTKCHSMYKQKVVETLPE